MVNQVNGNQVNLGNSQPAGTNTPLPIRTTITATAKVTPDLLLTLLTKSNLTPIISNQKITLNQSQILANQQVLLSQLGNQTALFLSSSLTSANLTLPAGLMAMFGHFHRQFKHNVNHPLPKELASFIAGKIGVLPEKLPQRLTQLHLMGNQLHIAFLSEPPILEIQQSLGRLSETTTANGSDLINLFIMLDKTAKSFASAQYSMQDCTQVSSETALSFDFTITIEYLGIARCAIKMKQFDLQITTHCSTQAMKTKIERQWPLLQQRFEQLGFVCWNTFSLIPEEQQETTGANHNLIDIKI